MDLIRTKYLEGILVITLNRPQVRNALSSQVIIELDNLCDQLLSADQKTRCVIVSGSGDKTFCAGADLKERQTMSEGETLVFVQRIQSTFQKIAKLPMPTIAAIMGDAFGGGLELALACDLRVLNANAIVGLTECSLGIIPGAGGTQRLPRLVGISLAMDMIFGARRITAQEALAFGLVNYIAANAEETNQRAFAIAMQIAKNAPLAVRAAKEAILLSQEKHLEDGLVGELASYHEILDSEDRKEGLRAFLEKRSPEFRGI